MYRQGDILIAPLAEDDIPPSAHDAPGEPRDARGRLILALGEVSSHAHAVVGPVRQVREADVLGPLLLHVPDGARFVHEEHAVIPLPRGWYRVVRQREYVPGAIRIVAD